MNRRSTTVVFAVIVMAIALLLSGVFSVLAMDHSYRDELLSRYRLPIVHLHHNLQRAVSYGVVLERAVGVERDLDATWTTLRELVSSLDDGRASQYVPSIAIVDTRGHILHRAGAAVDAESDDFLSALALPNGEGESSVGRFYVEGRFSFYIPMRIMGRDGHWTATVVAVLDKRPIVERLQIPKQTSIKSSGLMLLLGLIFYALLTIFVSELYADKRERLLSRLLWSSVVFAVAMMLAAAYSASRPYHDVYWQSTAEKAEVLVDIVATDTRNALSRGTPIEFLDFSHYPWRGLLAGAREIGAIEVLDGNRTLVVRVSRERFTHFKNEKLLPIRGQSLRYQVTDDLAVHAKTVGKDGQRSATVLARTSDSGMQGRIMDLVADVLAATMVSVLIFVELLLLFHYLTLRRCSQRGVPRADYASARIRPAAFMFLFGIDFSMSFVPLYAERLYEPILGLPRDVVVGLPISVEFLFVGVAMLGAGAWIDRVGWRRPFLTGTALAGLGAIYSWAAPDLMQFIAARGLLGVGYGLTLMASQSYVINRSNARSTAPGLAKLFAGVYGGSICGGVAGAILAEHFGFGPVFLAGGIIVFATLIYAAAVLPLKAATDLPKPQSEDDELALESERSGRLGRFLGNRVMLGLMLFSSLPASIAAVGFLNYFSPIYLSRIGASQSTIGQILMLYGICLVFFGPWISGSMKTIAQKKQAVLAGCLIGGAAFLSFRLLDGIMAAAVAVVLLGISHSLVLSSQSAYALALRVSHELGKGKAISVFRASGRLGQMLGPVAFGAVALVGSTGTSIVYMGYAYLVMALLFWVLTQRDGALLAEGEV